MIEKQWGKGGGGGGGGGCWHETFIESLEC